jgi:hypothetical protein
MNEEISRQQLAKMKQLAEAMAQVMEGKTPEHSMDELMESFPNPSKIQRAILAEIRKACARKEWNGLEEILAILGSWGDTLSEQDVLRYLRDITRSGTMMVELFEKRM